jgi:hypothetical protein
VIVSVLLVFWAIDNEGNAGFNEKLPVEPQIVPFTAKDVGTVLVAPFHVPLKPMPARLPPAAMLPL